MNHSDQPISFFETEKMGLDFCHPIIFFTLASELKVAGHRLVENVIILIKRQKQQSLLKIID